MSDQAAKRRARQTLINLLLSLGATAGLVILLVLAVPRDDSNRLQPVDYKSVAQSASDVAPGQLLAPTLDSGWYSNAARYRSAEQDGVASWYAGFVGPNSEFVAMLQAFDVNPTWMAQQLEATKPTGGALIADMRWEVYQNPSSNNPPASKDFIMVHSYGKNVVLLYGVAPFEAFQNIAGKLAEQLKEIE